MTCEKKCDKKYNPKGLIKINPYVARELYDCKASCNSPKKSNKGNKGKQGKQGKQGNKGNKGNKGKQGKQGKQGNKGNKGNKGKKLSLSRNSLILTRAKFKKPTKKQIKLRQRPNRTRKKAPSKTSL